MFDKNLFDSIIGQTYAGIIIKFSAYTVYTYENVAEIELEKGTLACYFHEGKCSRWSFYFHEEGKPDYHSVPFHSVPFVDLFPVWIFPTLPDGFGLVGLS